MKKLLLLLAIILVPIMVGAQTPEQQEEIIKQLEDVDVVQIVNSRGEVIGSTEDGWGEKGYTPPKYVPGEILVRFKEGVDVTKSAIRSKKGPSILDKIGPIESITRTHEKFFKRMIEEEKRKELKNQYIITPPDGMSAEELAEILRNDPGVEWAEPIRKEE